MTLHSEKPRCSEEQRTLPRLASSPAVLLEPPARTPPPRKDPEPFASLPASSKTAWPCGDTDFGCPYGCGAHFTQNKAHSWVFLHNKSRDKSCKTQQTSPSHTANARLPLSSIPEETSLGPITTTIHPPGDGPDLLTKFILLLQLRWENKEKDF